MLRAHFDLQKDPFDSQHIALLDHQKDIFDILLVHAQQSGLCLILGHPGTGKSVLKHALTSHWRWPDRELAGNTIDFFTKVLNRTFQQAMQEITQT